MISVIGVFVTGVCLLWAAGTFDDHAPHIVPRAGDYEPLPKPEARGPMDWQGIWIITSCIVFLLLVTILVGALAHK